MDGQLVSSEDKAQILAQNYEPVQWKVPLATGLPAKISLGAELPVELSPIRAEEVRKALRKLQGHSHARLSQYLDWNQWPKR